MARLDPTRDAGRTPPPAETVPGSGLDDVVISEEELTQIRLGDIAFGDAGDLGWE